MEHRRKDGKEDPGFQNGKTVGDVLKPPGLPPSQGFFSVVWCAVKALVGRASPGLKLGPSGRRNGE